ncbi:MAG: NADH-quinone oxidoreductase subunit M [Bacteroidetes bacterium]|nr:NADH-quinone oxidoreductase subunit M [Bacteroidota bacterium]
MLSLELLFIPLFASLLILFAKGKAARALALVFTLIQLLVTGYAYTIYKANGGAAFEFTQAWVKSPVINIHFGVDGISLLMVMLTNLLLPLIVLSGFNREAKRPHIFYALMLFMQFALNGVFLSMDAFVYYIFWELALIPIYFIAFNWGDENRAKVTIKFFIYTLVGSLLMLFGFVFLYLSSPQHSLDWNTLTQFKTCSCNQTWLFWLLFAAFAIKIPIFPFHTWQPDTYKSAPTQGTMLLSGIMLKMGTYSLIKWLLPIVPDGFKEWQAVVITLSVIGIVYASIIAIMQTDLKRLFAYSSIAHVGLIAAGVFSFTQQGLQGSLAQMFAHGINVVGLFFCADIILSRTGTLQISNLGGIRNQNRLFSSLFLIVVLGSVALPLTNGFIGEFLLLYGVFEYNTWLSVFAGLTIILGAVYMLRMFQNVMSGPDSEHISSFPPLHWNEKLVLILIGGLIILTGVFPAPILELTQPAIDNLLK